MASLAESLGYTLDQHRSNLDNFEKLKCYQAKYKKVSVIDSKYEQMLNFNEKGEDSILGMLNKLGDILRCNDSKNVKILHVVSEITRASTFEVSYVDKS
jgi:inositol polyphosphate-4-phosphatase